MNPLSFTFSLRGYFYCTGSPPMTPRLIYTFTTLRLVSEPIPSIPHPSFFVFFHPKTLFSAGSALDEIAPETKIAI
jgi:hypothetical protein